MQAQIRPPHPQSHSGGPSLRTRATVGSVIAVLLIGSLGFFSWRSTKKSAQEADLVGHTYEVMRILEATARDVNELRSSARGFSLSGYSSMLEHYRMSENNRDEDLRRLRQLTTDNPRQQERLATLEQDISRVTEFAEAIIQRRQTQKRALQAQQLGRGEALTIAAARTIKLMLDEEEQLLAERARETARARRLTRIVLLATTAASMAFLLLAALAINRQIIISEEARAEAVALNIGLEQRVLERTAALQSEIGARTAIAEQLRESQERLAGVIASAMDAVITIDAEQQIVLFNRAAENIFACSEREALGKSLEHFIPERFREAHRQHIASFAATGTTSRTMGGAQDLVALRADGLEFPIEASISQMESGGKKLFTAIVRDISERKRAEAEVLSLNQELEQRVRERTRELEATNKELEAFTYSVSHDLRAPLRHIAGFSKMLAEDCGDKLSVEAQHHLQRIQEGTRRMGLLVDDLLNLTRIGRQELRLQVTGLESVVRDVIAELAPDLAGRQVEWKIGSLPYVEADPALMKQVLQNLISNAVKYSRPRSPAVIEIGTRGQDSERVVFVRDNGVGFNMKYADKLFGVFQRLHRNEDFEGTGVGLATVHRILQKHGGCIWAEAELDKGATFFFTLNRSAEAGVIRAAAAGERA